MCWMNATASYRLALLNKNIVKDVKIFPKERNLVVIGQ